MNLTDFRWVNKAKIKTDGDAVIIEAHPQSDFFTDPATGESRANAAYLYRQVEGDFIFRGKVSHAFASDYDACALMMMADDDTYAKICYELTDFGGRCAISVVVADGRSDDANGADLGGGAVWLQIARKKSAVMFYHSNDGENWVIVRHFTFTDKPLKVGLVAQSPVGEGGSFRFENVMFENRAPDELWMGK